MHLVWTGVAKVLRDRGLDDLDFVLRGAVAGEVFAFGVSEAGNDLVLFGSDTEAAPDGDGGYRFTGTKIFTSLSPVWDHLGVHGLDTTSPDAPKMVFAFLDRATTASSRATTGTPWACAARKAAPPNCTGRTPPRTASCAVSIPDLSPIRSSSASSRCSRS